MAFYNVRDLLGHWVKPKSRRGKMCPHACCKGKRVHPANFPVLLPRQLLRTAREGDLIEHYAKHTDNERVQRQIFAEVDRRQDAEKRRAAAKESRKRAAWRRKIDREELAENAYQRAEAATRGGLVNRAGVRAGVSARSLFTGSESRALRYASHELLEYWETHPRPSAGLLSANPHVLRAARARSDVGRVDVSTYRHLY